MTVTLRKFLSSDAERLVQLANNRNVSRYLLDSFPSPYTAADAEWWISTGNLQAGCTRVIEADGLFVGCIGLAQLKGSKAHLAEIGYWMGEEYWEKGLTSQAVKLMLSVAFDELKVKIVFAPVYSPNVGSMRVLEKCGFVREAVHKAVVFREGRYLDEVFFYKYADGFLDTVEQQTSALS